jgi:hypothetical protein
MTVPTVKINYSDENHPEEELYDMLTEDHSFIANDLCVFSTFPEIEKHPFVTLFTLLLLQKTFISHELDSGISILQIQERVSSILEKHGEDVVFATRMLVHDEEFLSALPLFFAEKIIPILQQTEYVEMSQVVWEYYDRIKSLAEPSRKNIVETLLGLDSTTEQQALDPIPSMMMSTM